MKLRRSQRFQASLFAGVVSTVLVGSLYTIIVVGNLQLGGEALRDASQSNSSGRQLLQTVSAATRAHNHKLQRVHGWLMCLAWGALIPISVVVAAFRTICGAGTWWFHLHRVLNILGFLVSLAGLSVGVYLDPGEGGLVWKHKIIGITVNVLAFVQILVALLIKPKNTSKLRRTWNLTHWTLGRATLALAIANIFIGMYLSHVAHRHIVAQAVVLGGLFIIIVLKNDIEYLLVGCTPAEEEAKLRAVHIKGSQTDAGQTNFPALASANGHAKATNGHAKAANGHTQGKGKGEDVLSTDPSILDTNNSIPDTHGLTPNNGSETAV